MQGKNLKAIIRICNQNECRDFDEPDFPLAVGITFENDFIFGDAAKSSPAGWFGLLDNQIFFQPVEGYLVRFNEKKLDSSTWLDSGDKIEIDKGLLNVSIDDGLTVLSYDVPAKIPELIPPDEPAEKKAGNTDDSEPASELIIPENENRLPEFSQDNDHFEPGEATFITPLPKAKSRSRLHKILLAIFILLLFSAAFLVIAIPVTIKITPAPDNVSMSRFPLSIKVGERYLTLPGSYNVIAKKGGYRDLDETIKTRYGKDTNFQYNLVKLPGLLSVYTEPIGGAEVRVDGDFVGKTPLLSIEVEAGPHEFSITKERYLPVEQKMEINGKGENQSLGVILNPGWGTLKVKSKPEGAEVWLNGVKAGLTPLEAEPLKGTYTIEVKKEGWMGVTKNIKIEPGDMVEISDIKLQKVMGMIKLTSSPSGASVIINSEFRGNTPVLLAIIPEKENELILTKIGFSRASKKIHVTSGQTKTINISLKPEYGTLFITSEPVDSTLKIDGKEKGSATQRLRLTTVSHLIEVSKPGYAPYSETLTPVVGISKKLKIFLDKLPDDIKTSEGQLLRKIKLNKPVQFKMGSSRREPGRRSNEAQYTVELTQTFFISEREVTNAEFKRFRQIHNSGKVYGISLNEKEQPVSSVTWNDAVAYLNWLSKKDGLPPAYTEKNGKLVAIMPMTTGYRLPTEAEWAFVARYQGRVTSDDNPIKFPWGNNRYPKEKCGNFADNSAKNTLPLTIKDYSDGYAVAAPVCQFPENTLGICDLGGNVSEWCHDFYDIQSGFNNKILVNPTGPASGKYHVVRGSSWHHGSITELRLTYRDYIDKGRNDIGFRIARYEDNKN